MAVYTVQFIPSDDPGFRVYQDRVIETELGDAGCDLRDLGVGVGPWVARVWDQLLESPVLNALRHSLQSHPHLFWLRDLSEAAPVAPAYRTEPLTFLYPISVTLYTVNA
jgi:hypothetical protein